MRCNDEEWRAANYARLVAEADQYRREEAQQAVVREVEAKATQDEAEHMAARAIVREAVRPLQALVGKQLVMGHAATQVSSVAYAPSGRIAIYTDDDSTVYYLTVSAAVKVAV